ncbi:MAG: hypothetical protein NC900_01590 [Candidatus Omnitrophica bacterium]|nr:hypothetical protein [Candidatus Omnitrophota bacterium]
MTYHLKIWQKELNLRESCIYIFFLIILFLLVEFHLFLKLKSFFLFNEANLYIQKIKQLDKNLITQRVILYQNTLRLLEISQKIDPLKPNYHFDYAKVLLEVFEDKAIFGIIGISKISSEDQILELIETQYKKAIFLNPSNAIYHLGLGYFYGLRDDLIATEQEFKKASLLDPNSIDNHLYITKYFLNKVDPERALFYLNKTENICKAISYSFDTCKELETIKEKIVQ